MSAFVGKLKSVEDFSAYMKTPERAAGSEFELLLRKCGAGETKVYWGEANLV